MPLRKSRSRSKDNAILKGERSTDRKRLEEASTSKAPQVIIPAKRKESGGVGGNPLEEGEIGIKKPKTAV